MSSLDDIIGECQKIADVERIQKLEPDPLCLIVRVNVPQITLSQIQMITTAVEVAFEKAGVKPPPILVADKTVDFMAIPKSGIEGVTLYSVDT